MVKIPLEIVELQSDGFHILIEAEIFDTSFKMVVDTGASKTVFDKTTLLQAGIDQSRLQSTDLLSSGLGTNNMESFFTVIPQLRLNDWKVSNLPCAVLDLSTINYAYQQMGLSPIVGVLGGDILLPYAAIIHYRSETLQLNERRRKR